MDKILEMFFEPERWEYAIEKGVGKDMPKGVLYQLCKPEMRVAMYTAIREGRYEIAPPHIARIPKDTPGEFREVSINEPIDRIALSIMNDLLFELMPDKIHPSCTSYQKGIGCGKIVQEASKVICETSKTIKDGKLGWKSDLSKYFDSVPIEYIDAAFDSVEARHGKSAIIDVLRKYYHSDLYFDIDGNLTSSYQSLKQGCSPASWLADVILYHIDEKLSNLNGYYVRYSDDSLFIGEDNKKAMAIMKEELGKMGMKLNPKKVEMLDANHWFKFLGYSIKGKDISLSSSRIKRFQREIEARTIRIKDNTLTKAVHSVNNYLYHGDMAGHSWSTGILSVVNVRRDVDELNKFVMDCLRAVETKHTKIGGLGYRREQAVGCICRGSGRHVNANRKKTSANIEGYITLGCMQNAIRTSKSLYDTLVRQL